MKKITRDAAFSYLKWNLYILNGIRANLKNSKDLLKITSVIGIAIIHILNSTEESKAERILVVYQKTIETHLLNNKQASAPIIESYNRFLISLKSFIKDKDIKQKDLDLKDLEQIMNKSNYQA